MSFPTDLALDTSVKSRLCRYVTNALVLLSSEAACLNHVDEVSISLLIREVLRSSSSRNLSLLLDSDSLVEL